MLQDQTEQRDLQCPNCAGQRVFDPAERALCCQSCGDAETLNTDVDGHAAAEFPYDPDTPRSEAICAFRTQAHHCETCGGDVTFTGAALSERCPYCDGPVVLAPADIAFQTMALIPFSEPLAQAETLAQGWIQRRWAAPNDLAAAVAKGRIAGLYAPFFTFDSEEALQYWARYKVKSGKKTYSRSTTGRMHISFDDLLVPASHHVTPLIRDGILHDFDSARLRPFDPGYLAGFAAERHHQSLAEGLRSNEDDKDLLIRNRIKRHVNKRGVHSIRYRTDTSGIHYRRILLPVWILHYQYKGKPMQVIVSGIDGRTFGTRPFSAFKLAAFSAALTAAALAFGVFWGAAGFL